MIHSQLLRHHEPDASGTARDERNLSRNIDFRRCEKKQANQKKEGNDGGQAQVICPAFKGTAFQQLIEIVGDSYWQHLRARDAEPIPDEFLGGGRASGGHATAARLQRRVLLKIPPSGSCTAFKSAVKFSFENSVFMRFCPSSCRR